MRDWNEGRAQGIPVETLLSGAARSLPPGTAHQIFRAASVTMGEGATTDGAGPEHLEAPATPPKGKGDEAEPAPQGGEGRGMLGPR